MAEKTGAPAICDVVTRARELVAAATPGPWAWDNDLTCLGGGNAEDPFVLHDLHTSVADADAALIAAAPTLIAALADELAILHQAHAELTDECARLQQALEPFAKVWRPDLGDDFDDNELIAPELEARHWKRAADVGRGSRHG